LIGSEPFPFDVGSTVEFGNAVDLSADGITLVVGAPLYDWADESATVQNQDGGAVFVYKLVADSWNMIWFKAGNMAENMGDRVALSSDGTTVAVRRYNSDYEVEIYDITGTPGTANGSPIPSIDEGSAIAISGDGTRVAVSVEKEDSYTGSVTVYDYSGTVWSAVGSTLLGPTAYDRFGSSVALSTSGTRLAVGSPNFEEDKEGLVQVFDITGGDWEQLGQNLTGVAANDRFGVALDISGDGTHIIVGASGAQTNDGTVDVYKYETSAWVQVGSQITTGVTNGRFGQSVTISESGDRIAATSFTNYGSRGLMRIYEFSGGDWVQIGDELIGANSDRLGGGVASVSMTSDGSTVGVGSLYKKDGNGMSVGQVQVVQSSFSTQAPTDSPSISPTDVPSRAPTNVPTDEPTHAPTNVPTDIPVEAPTNVPINASTNAPSSGPSNMPSSLSSENPSNYPSSMPSSRPSSSPPTDLPSSMPSSSPSQDIPAFPPTSPTTENPSVAPSTSEEPSAIASAEPSVGPSFKPSDSPTSDPIGTSTIGPSTGPTSGTTSSVSTPTTNPTANSSVASPSQLVGWDITSNGPASILFTDAASSGEVMLSFNLSDRDTVITLYEEDCITPLSTEYVSANETYIPLTATQKELQVTLDIKQDSIADSPIWSSNATNEGQILMCVRVDINLNATSVHFLETVLDVSITMSQGFHLLDVDTARIGPDTDMQAAAVDYDLTACQCDLDMNCVNETLTQGSILNVCVFSQAGDTVFAGIETLNLMQDLLTFPAIANGETSPLTAVTIQDQSVLIRTRLISAFFAESSPADIVVDGVAVFSFGGSNVRRLREGKLTVHRQAEEDLSSSAFEFDLKLDNGITSGAIARAATATLAVMTIGAYFLL